MMLRNWRKTVGTAAVVLGMTVPIFTVSTATVTAVGGQSTCDPPGPGAIATTDPGTLCVESSSNGSTTDPFDTGILKGDLITEFNWLVNDDSGTGDPSFTVDNVAACLPSRAKPTAEEAATNPVLAQYATAGDSPLADCPWPSVHASAGHADVIASGNQDDITSLRGLADGKYLMSVTAPGYKIDGVHFTIAAGVVTSVNEEAGKPFIVRMNPLPKKTLTVRVHVFNDNASTNGQWDGQTETLLTCDLATPEQLTENCGGVADPLRVADPSTDMSGFSVAANDVLDTTTTDVFGNPLCTQYETDGNGNVLLDEEGSPTPITFGDGGSTGGALSGTESTCISDHYGDIVIPNMGPNRYAITVVPPDPRVHKDAVWVRSTTLEGGHDWDSWNIEGGNGYDTELIVGGERTTPVIAGFVKLTNNDDVWDAAEAGGTNSPAEVAYYNASGGFLDNNTNNKQGVMTGKIVIGRAYIASGGGAPLAMTNITNAKIDEDKGIDDGIISVSCIATCNAPTDSVVWAGRARQDGTFRVNGLETGDYVVSFWDESQTYILATMQYSVVGEPTVTTVALPAITSATVVSGQRRLTWASNPGLVVGQQITLSGSTGNFGRWNGTFTVNTVSNVSPFTTTVTRNFGTQPSASPTTLPTATTTITTPAAPTDVGNILLPGWFTEITGHVFNDLDGDGFKDDGEPGIPDFGVVVRTRGNSLQDQGNNAANTNEDGEYDLTQAYPLGQFLILEAYNPRYKSTGFTYTTDNDRDGNGDRIPHTVVSAQVDINFLPVIGLSATVDWGVQAYGTGTDYWGRTVDGVNPMPASPDENGAIVGTVTYDTTRNEFDPAKSAQEDYQPGVPHIAMQLWETRRTDGINHDTYDGPGESGAIKQYGVGGCVRPDALRGTNAVFEGQDCKPLDYYVTESWTRPTDCTALDINGDPLEGELALPDHQAEANVDYSHTDSTKPECVEAPMSGIQIGGEGTVDGNYALTSLMRPESLAGAPAGGVDLENFYADAQNNEEVSDPISTGDYVVEAVNPLDTINTKPVFDPNLGGVIDSVNGNPNRLYRFTDENAINVFSGDVYVPQDGFSGPPAGGGGPGDPLRADPSSRIRYDRNSLGTGTVAQCAGSMHTVPETGSAESIARDPDFDAGGGNPFDGRVTPICDAKLVTVGRGHSMPAGFFMYTDVPLPAKFYGLVNDDLNVQTDRRSIMLGEVAGVANAPVGVYDENGNWKYTAHSDVNGFYEVLLPSTGTYNCPLPAGPCANVYRLVGNDPGTLSHRNLDYNPQFRTIATEFQAWPGVVHPVDQAPVHNGITIEGPAAQFGALSLCQSNLPDTPATSATPELYAINRPFYDPGDGTFNSSGGSAGAYTIQGNHFGTSGSLRMDGTVITTTGWSDTQITFAASAVSGLSQAPHQLSITNGQSGLSTVNGLTFHRLSPGSTGTSTYLQRRDVYEVSSANATDNAGARTYSPMHDAWDAATNTAAGFAGVDVNGLTVSGGRAIQRAVEAARGQQGGNNPRPKLVVIYPNTASNYAPHNPFAAYFENVVLHSKIMLQGVGPGGARSNTDIVFGTNIDAGQFWSATQVVPPGGNQDTSDGSYSDDWRTFTATFNNALGDPELPQTRAGTGPVDLPEGEGILAIAESQTQWGGTSAPSVAFRPGVDGVLLTGGDQQGNPGNVNTAPGAVGESLAPANPGPAQGGAIMLDQFVRDFQITNNQIQTNGGTYGTIRIGTPDLTDNAGDNNNDRLRIASNRILANGGSNLAGALGLFAGADNYVVTANDFCGNFSAEYGGAISHYGRSNNGLISRNRVYYNQGYDEGGGIMIAGALPANNSQLSFGAGAVTVDSNIIVSNQSNDDGGGLRFLMAGNFAEIVSNNIIANNLSTHEGAGVALDDAPNVSLVNNTIVKNITTATAATNSAVGNIKEANPAGLSSGGNSSLLQASLPAGSPNWSKPKLLNNIFADNRAGWAELPTAFNSSALHGIGQAGDTEAIQRWDIGVASATGLCNAYSVSTGCSVPFAFDGANNTTNTRAAGALVNMDATAASYIGTDNIDPALDGAEEPVATGGIGFVNPQDFLVDSLMWRVDTNVSFPVMVAHYVPISLLANYHITENSAPTLALNGGAASGGGTSVPTAPLGFQHDVDSDARPALGGYDRGADELRAKTSDLAITIDDLVTQVSPSQALVYTITVTNLGPDAVTNATVTDTLPASLVGSNLSTNVSLAPGASQVFTVDATVAVDATGSIANTATVAAPFGWTDPVNSNNSATDTDIVPLPLPTLTVLDNFNRANANTLGANWSQATLFGVAAIQVNSNQANQPLLPGQAIWNNPAGGYGTKQGAAFTFANTPNVAELVLKATLGTAASPQNFLRVRYNPAAGGSIVVESTTNSGGSYAGITTFPGVSFATGDTFTAVANADGSVDVWKNSTYIGRSATSAFTAGGRIGMQLGTLLVTGERVDNFAGGNA